MAKEKIPTTSAIRTLREHDAPFTSHPYSYEEKGGTEVAARELGVEEHLVVKTLVMEDECKSVFLVLMHGDREVSTRALARAMGAKSVSPCPAALAERVTGYKVGGISPFGTRKELPTYVEESILALPRIYINGGRRGLMVKISPHDLIRILRATPIQAARE